MIIEATEDDDQIKGQLSAHVTVRCSQILAHQFAQRHYLQLGPAIRYVDRQLPRHVRASIYHKNFEDHQTEA
jgi:hypothetical protein